MCLKTIALGILQFANASHRQTKAGYLVGRLKKSTLHVKTWLHHCFNSSLFFSLKSYPFIYLRLKIITYDHNLEEAMKLSAGKYNGFHKIMRPEVAVAIVWNVHWLARVLLFGGHC